MRRAIDRFLFPVAPATRPAVLRIMLGTYALWYLGRRYRMLLAIARSDPATFQPVGVASSLDRPLPVAVFRRLLLATLLANLAFVLGWNYRYTGPLFSGLLLWVLSYRNSWSMIFHNDNALVLHALVLGVAPAADALSLDALGARTGNRRRRPGRLGAPPQPVPVGWWYGWPVRLMSIATAMTYFVSGVAKVAGPLGWRWADGEALRSQVAVDGLRKELLGGEASPWLCRLHDRLGLFRAIGLGTLALELGAPVALVAERPARLWALGTYGMHWGILVVMGIKFRYQLSGLIFASFFDVERLLLVAPRRRGGRAR